MNKIFQCCYTNDISDTNGNISSGWRTVAVSPDIPQDALETCEKLQNANSSISSGMTDEFGNVLNLEEIFGDGNYIYVINTKYGMLDRLGRANMFSHAFIFSCRAAESVENPNAFLAIAESNFKDNKAAAEQLCSMPSIPVRNKGYNIKDALSSCRLGESEYRTLLYCVYVHIAEKKIPEPLFVEYDGTWSNRRELLYCIYFGLPFSVRRRLSSVSCPTANTGEKNIVFTINAKSKEYYIIPQTGENNVLSPRLEKRLSRYGFVDYAAGHYSTVGFENYFTELETKAVELGDETAYDKLFLKIAHLFITEQGISSLGKISDDELVVRLSDALRTQSWGNLAMDGYIAGLLSEIRQRKLTLTDEMETLLANRAGNSAGVALPDIAEKYKKHDNAAAQDCLEKKAVDDDTWEKIERELSSYNEEIAKRAWDLYSKELSNIHSKKFNAIAAYNKYIHIVKKIFIKDVEQYAAAKNAYWEKIDFGEVSFSNLWQYQALETEDTKSKMIILYASLPRILKEKGEKNFFDNVNCVFVSMDELTGIGVSDKKLARERLLSQIKIENHNLDKSFDVWYMLSCRIPRKAMKLFLEMYDAFHEGNKDALRGCYSEFYNICEDYKVGRDIQDQFDMLIKERCRSIGRK